MVGARHSVKLGKKRGGSGAVYTLNLPRKLIERLGWERGDEISFSLHPHPYKENELDKVRLDLINEKRKDYITPLDFVKQNHSKFLDWSNKFPPKDKNKLVTLQEKMNQDNLKKQTPQELAKEGLGVMKSEIDGKLKIYPLITISKEDELKGLVSRKFFLRKELGDISKKIKAVKRRKI
jgi:hypothetical protein